MHIVYYTGDFNPVERCERKLDGVVDVWLRRDAGESVNEDGNQIKMAEEIYLKFPIDEAPTFDELLESIDEYFEKDTTPETTIEDIMSAINDLTDLILGGDL